MTQTELLKLPFIASSQAQKHITHNEAIRMLDALLHLAVKDKTHTAPPQDPDAGDRYIVAENAADAWEGRSGQIAAWQDGAWAYFIPVDGWRVWVEAEKKLYAWQTDGWMLAGGASELQDQPYIGVNATADDTNRLSIKSPASLFSHEGAGHQIKLNKKSEADTASFLYQTNWSGRTEMGLAGNDDFSIKVSGDGNAWKTALAIAKGDAVVSAREGINSGTMILAHNSFGTIDVPRAGGLLFLWNSDDPFPENSRGRYAILYFDVGDSPRRTNILIDAGIDILQSGTPTGTAGNDTALSIYIGERKIQLENRRGGLRSYRWLILS